MQFHCIKMSYSIEPRDDYSTEPRVTVDLIGNKIADKITSVSKKSSAEHSKNDDSYSEIEVPKKRYISPEERQQII